ncbi:2-oxoglutarate dehydrogenase E1 component [Marinicellulosiphila megalodicopiae]|uniref:2-oxoglutarate dehydrogenase E1 component n=1 Tax=Marinicellulosiphila megalodicopiae TaxID=2724896 RepID=UPI003BAF6143
MQDTSMDELWSSSHLAGGNSAFLEELYEAYLIDPNSVPENWRDTFNKLPNVNDQVSIDVPHSTVREHFAQYAKDRKRLGSGTSNAPEMNNTVNHKQAKFQRLTGAYRMRGHQKAILDPLSLISRKDVPDLDLHYHELSKADEDTIFDCSNLFLGKDNATLKEVVEALEATYCSSIGAEFTHITDTKERRWVEARMESTRSKPDFSDESKLHILERLTAAEGLEKYLGSRYPGTKRFGLEGGEAFIPLMDEMIQRFGSYGAKEIVIGMAHRGRLNMLINVLGKNPRELFDEFEGKAIYEKSGDVKYHQGFSSNVETEGGEVHLAMAFNPSHLEIVSPVIEGSVRARQDRRGDTERKEVVPVSIHGDAAFCGQGVVMETFQASQTRAYGTGGTFHIVINNQVGFTTNKREDVRSTEYCTDIAKMVQAPIFHVNADDLEAVIFVTQMAVDFRQQFNKDVVIDLVCYRRRGHNEADEPSGTQPLMYSAIKKQKTTWELYCQKLIAEGLITQDQQKSIANEYRSALDNGKHVARALVTKSQREFFVDWTPFINQEVVDEFDSSIDLSTMQDIAMRMSNVPADFPIQRQVQKIYEDRAKMAQGAMPINWGFAESLGFATLLEAGEHVRITGQDVGRGTFSHRHAVLHNQNDASLHIPMQHLNDKQGRLTIHDSFLSEFAVLGFEYGYATTSPDSLVIWEAQFGDFANGAQVVIDQFITSGEHKWGRLCGLCMFLPHGYEGQGPEHSSARLERYLQLCAEHNIQVCMPTTPAQIFHMIRRQQLRNLRKPLIVMTPKSLLRHKAATSTLEELAEGQFQTVLAETDENIKASKVKRIVLCSGRVYYDLLERRERDEITDVALVRIEQLYPFPEVALLEVLNQYKSVTEVTWCQEEPVNQGAWYSSQHHIRHVLHQYNPKLTLAYAGREASAAAAAGYLKLHLEQLEQLLNDALVINK